MLIRNIRRILLIIILILTLGFFIPNPVLAVKTDCNKNSSSPPVGPFVSNCPIVGLNDDLVVWVYPFDEWGYWIFGTPVSYTWTISDANLGSFTTANSPTCTIIGPVTQCQENNSIAGYSTVNLHASSIIVAGATITATASYVGGIATKTFNLSSDCLTDPMLYYGIASVSEQGKNTYQSSTAEILETCRPEYILYDGVGEGQ